MTEPEPCISCGAAWGVPKSGHPALMGYLCDACRAAIQRRRDAAEDEHVVRMSAGVPPAVHVYTQVPPDAMSFRPRPDGELDMTPTWWDDELRKRGGVRACTP